MGDEDARCYDVMHLDVVIDQYGRGTSAQDFKIVDYPPHLQIDEKPTHISRKPSTGDPNKLCSLLIDDENKCTEESACEWRDGICQRRRDRFGQVALRPIAMCHEQNRQDAACLMQSMRFKWGCYAPNGKIACDPPFSYVDFVRCADQTFGVTCGKSKLDINQVNEPIEQARIEAASTIHYCPTQDWGEENCPATWPYVKDSIDSLWNYSFPREGNMNNSWVIDLDGIMRCQSNPNLPDEWVNHGSCSDKCEKAVKNRAKYRLEHRIKEAQAFAKTLGQEYGETVLGEYKLDTVYDQSTLRKYINITGYSSGSAIFLLGIYLFYRRWKRKRNFATVAQSQGSGTCGKIERALCCCCNHHHHID